MAKTEWEVMGGRAGKGGEKSKEEKDHSHKEQKAAERPPTSRTGLQCARRTRDLGQATVGVQVKKKYGCLPVLRQFSCWSPAGGACAPGSATPLIPVSVSFATPWRRSAHSTLIPVSVTTRHLGLSVSWEQPFVGATYHWRPKARRETHPCNSTWW